jgi:hypothetical protein
MHAEPSQSHPRHTARGVYRGPSRKAMFLGPLLSGARAASLVGGLWGQWGVCSGWPDARVGGSERLGSGQVVAAGGSPPGLFELGGAPSRHEIGVAPAVTPAKTSFVAPRPTMLLIHATLHPLFSTTSDVSMLGSSSLARQAGWTRRPRTETRRDGASLKNEDSRWGREHGQCTPSGFWGIKVHGFRVEPRHRRWPWRAGLGGRARPPSTTCSSSGSLQKRTGLEEGAAHAVLGSGGGLHQNVLTCRSVRGPRRLSPQAFECAGVFELPVQGWGWALQHAFCTAQPPCIR